MADFFVVDVEDLPQAVAPQDEHTSNVSQSWTREQAVDYGVHVPEPILLKGVGGSTLYVKS